jgi:hypothetical protein
MSYAAAAYRRQYSEDLGNDPGYPVWLEASVEASLSQIVSGTLDLLDDSATINEVGSVSSPSFYPNDAADETDPRAFSMGMVF